MPNIQITWGDVNRGVVQEDGFNIYRSLTPFTVDTLPAVLVSLPADSTSYLDTSASTGLLYYYGVGVIKGSNIALAGPYSILASGVAAGPVYVPIQDARLIVNWAEDTFTDESKFASTGSISGSLSASGGVATFDGTQHIEVDLDPNELYFMHDGDPFTIEFEVSRYTGSAGGGAHIIGNIHHTGTISGQPTGDRGFAVRGKNDGSLRLYIGRGIANSEQFYHEWTGVIPATGLHRVVIECKNLLAYDSADDNYWLGVDGVRIGGEPADNLGISAGAPTGKIFIGANPSGAVPYEGEIGAIKINKGIVYDLENNATYTQDPTPFETTELHEFKPFEARQMLPINWYQSSGVLYAAFPSGIPLNTDGDAILGYSLGPDHAGAGNANYQVTTDNFGRDWSLPVLANDSRGASEGTKNSWLYKMTSGRIVQVYGVRDWTGNTLELFSRYSDNDGVTWSAELSITADFSATMQARGDGPYVYGPPVMTSNGLMIVGWPNFTFNTTGDTHLEGLFSSDGATWGSPVTIVGSDVDGSYRLNETLIIADDMNNQVAISRSGAVADEATHYVHQTDDGWSTNTYIGKAVWAATPANATYHPPCGIKLSDNRLLLAFCERNGRDLYYTLTNMSDFMANPLRAFDGTETRVFLHKKALDVAGGPSESGYIWPMEVSPGNIVFAWYECWQSNALRTRIITKGVVI